MSHEAPSTANSAPKNFIRHIIDEDNQNQKHGGRVATRFPPEPNGYLHIGHAKSICLNFGLARDYSGSCNLRFDDTNPAAEEVEYVESIQADVQWLGFNWTELHYASDYFDMLYKYAQDLIRADKAYVCHLSPDQIREYRGTLTAPGRDSPYRGRSAEESLKLFEEMKNGKFAEGECVLRAKIDMASPNINMRDPAIYRVKKAHHHRTGDKWNIYPMYDYAHCISDALERITHSICTLEFEDHRPLYDWILDQLDVPAHPQQIEFARLNLTYTVMSKRKLLQLVKEKHVNGWDDPRLPTLQGYRRRGYTPASIRTFCEKIGVTKKDSLIDVGTLEGCLRDDLNEKAPRIMAVLKPIKVTLVNYPEGQTETIEAPVHPQKPELGTRTMSFGRTLYIESDDFMEVPAKKFFRLAPGAEVKLRYAYVIKCLEVVKDASGNVIELKCEYDPGTKSGAETVQKKVKGVIHWVSETGSERAEVRLYDRLFAQENTSKSDDGKDFLDMINPNSLELIQGAWIEKSIASAKAEDAYQFERLGYFVVDRKDSKPGALVFNRAVTLRDTWAAENKG
ncbi:MAG TPA: glutamine--tRNA ligase/YqeY domain fusion protein [Bdellovibrionota bacterium]|jgi:glutaminyl-tRNA synthetase|nr:glutamine--tRNA ligase/YqeY domain fusion protein [Bdellovibrionota bacterium]